MEKNLINKGKYCYMEIVPKFLTNRGKYINSQEVINYAFEHRYTETWRGMFLFSTDKPKSTDKMIGNFYIESDNENFDVNVKIIKTAIEYMQKKYNLDEYSCNFQITNRSIWCEIPSKVFGIYPQEELNKIYKEMAKEINEYICTSLEIQKALDLSIYKWNGLIHALGSYLPKTNRWVNKVDYYIICEKSPYHLRENYNSTLEYLLDERYDNFKDFKSIETIPECKEWFNKVKKNLNYQEMSVPSLIKGYSLLKDSYIKKIKQVINELEKIKFEEGNRNNLIFTYSLALKHLSIQNEEIEKKIKQFIKERDKNYYNLNKREIMRSINSAIHSSYGFSFEKVNELFGFSIEFEENEYVLLNTFIIPRQFIEILNKNKSHWMCYKLLLKVIHSEQFLNKHFIYNLKGEKYKERSISHFKKLKEMGIINYTQNKDLITVNLLEQSYEFYSNYIIMPCAFIENKIFEELQKEIKVFCEILRSNYIGKYEIHMTNIKVSTICKNLSMTKEKVRQAINKLKKNHVVCGKYITFGSKKLCKFISDVLLRRKKKNYFKINKMIYSIKLKNTINEDISTLYTDIQKNIMGITNSICNPLIN